MFAAPHPLQVEPEQAGDRVLPVLPALRGLLPDGGLRRGSIVAVDGPGALLWALAAGASDAGAWCATVGLPELGLVAAAEAGVAIDRLLVVDDAGSRWAEVVATLLDGVEVVLARSPGRLPPQIVRRVAAVLRRQGGVLMVVGAWEGAWIRLRVASSVWTGVGAGHGHLRGRRAEVVAEGRGAGGRPRVARLWLPGPEGAVTGPDLARDIRPVGADVTGAGATGSDATGSDATGSDGIGAVPPGVVPDESGEEEVIVA